MLNLNYDSKYDVLYISIGEPRPSYGDEDTPGIVVLHDIKTDEITGITIFDFKKRINDNSITNVDLPIRINFNDDVTPFIS